MPNLIDPKADNDVVAMSALAMSMVFVGQCREDIAAPILEKLMQHPVDAAATESGMELRSDTCPRVITRSNLSTRCYLRRGRTLVVGPHSSRAMALQNC